MANISTKLIAGVQAPDTPLITKALEFARYHLDDVVFNHVVRSWLLAPSSQIIFLRCKGETWSFTPSPRPSMTLAGQKTMVLYHLTNASKSTHRLQLAWDTIALHITTSIAAHKEIEVQSCMIGIVSDFTGPEHSPGGVLTREVWNGVVKEYPRLGFKEGVKEVMCDLCRTEPDTTYDNFVAEFGEKFVEGYGVEGHRIIDIINSSED